MPIEFVATMRIWYAPVNARLPSPVRPSHGICCGPGTSFPVNGVAITIPVRVSTVTTTVAGWMSWKVAVAAVVPAARCAAVGVTTSPLSVSLSENVRVAVVVRPWSSEPVTWNVHVPSGAAAPDAVCPYHWRMCWPGASLSAASVSVEPPGPASVAVTCDCRTTLYKNVCVSAAPSPFGERTLADGGAA